MSYDAIQQVTKAEQEARAGKAEAAAEAKRILAEADRMGRQAVAQAKADAEEKVKAMIADAEVRAQANAKLGGKANADRCEALKAEARLNLERASDLIVEKVGNH